MNVRPASFRDLGRIEQLYRETTALQESEGVLPALASDSPVPQTTLVRLWYAVSMSLAGLVPISDQGAALIVADDPEQGIVGFVQAQKAAGQRRAWQVVNLCVAPTGRGHFAGGPLLTHLMAQGMEHGISRFHVRLPVDHPRIGLFLEHGFTQYATETILFRDDSGAEPRLSVQDPAAGIIRPARREDAAAVYLLYLRTTPSHVANLEGPNLKAWQDSFQQGVVQRVGRDDVRHFVCERPGVVGWAALRPPSQTRPTVMSLMCDAQDPGLADQLVDAALAQAQPGPVSCVLRHYDSELIRVLRTRGFEIFGSQLLLVRDLALRVRLRAAGPLDRKRGVLVHAGLVRGSGPARVMIRRPDPGGST